MYKLTLRRNSVAHSSGSFPLLLRPRGRRAVYSCNAQTRRVTFRDFTRTRRCGVSLARRPFSHSMNLHAAGRQRQKRKRHFASRTMTSHELAESLSLFSAISRRRYFANDIMLVLARHSLHVFPETRLQLRWNTSVSHLAYSRHPAYVYVSHERCHAHQRCEVRSDKVNASQTFDGGGKLVSHTPRGKRDVLAFKHR